jgi:hypothetical protein
MTGGSPRVALLLLTTNQSIAQINSNSRDTLILDEIQKLPGWSETVKRLWDEDTAAERELQTGLCSGTRGSASGRAPGKLVARGMHFYFVIPSASEGSLAVCRSVSRLSSVTADSSSFLLGMTAARADRNVKLQTPL